MQTSANPTFDTLSAIRNSPQVLRDFVGQVRVGLLHARDGGLQIGVTARLALFVELVP